MSKVYLKDFYIANNTSDIKAVSWQISDDSNFNNIIDESIFDIKNILSWTPSIKVNNKLLDIDNIDLYARLKIYLDNNGSTTESDWYVAKMVDGKNNYRDITYKKKIIGKIRLKENSSYDVLF